MTLLHAVYSLCTQPYLVASTTAINCDEWEFNEDDQQKKIRMDNTQNRVKKH